VTPRLAVVVKGFPRLSETFIAQEILGLEQRGLDLLIVSLRHPTDPAVHDLHDQIRAPVLYLPEYVLDEPWRVIRGAWRCLKHAGLWSALLCWLRDLRRDATANRGRRFAQALVLAAELPGEVGHLHVHFLHTPGSVGRYAARILGLTYSLSAHAKDIWTTAVWEKRQKLLDARWTVTCTRHNLRHLREIAPEADVELVHHGLDLARLSERQASHRNRSIILCVARAIEKKGLDTLLKALALLPPDLEWHFEHIGGGALVESLRSRAECLGLTERVHWLGPQPRDAVLAAYRRARLFCLPSRIAADGDRDGLPNVLMEAMSQGLPVVSTSISAIPEIVEDGVTGVLVPPDDANALAAAIERLLREPAWAETLAEAARLRIKREFSMEQGIDRIAARLHDYPPPLAALACASPSTPR
jgi:colanic acid/amylovoran biosynthesis glycosyltransferase